MQMQREYTELKTLKHDQIKSSSLQGNIPNYKTSMNILSESHVFDHIDE